MSKHTPGPWYESPFGDVNLIRGSNHPTVGDVVCRVSFAADDWKANSSLIAAAPEMLDELRAWADGFDAFAEPPDTRLGRRVKSTKALIAKAMGHE